MLEDDSDRNQDLVASLQELVDIRQFLLRTVELSKDGEGADAKTK